MRQTGASHLLHETGWQDESEGECGKQARNRGKQRGRASQMKDTGHLSFALSPARVKVDGASARGRGGTMTTHPCA